VFENSDMWTCRRHLSKHFGSDAKHLKSKNTRLPEVMGLCFHSATILSILARTNTSIWKKTPKWKEKLPETFDRGEYDMTWKL